MRFINVKNNKELFSYLEDNCSGDVFLLDNMGNLNSIKSNNGNRRMNVRRLSKNNNIPKDDNREINVKFEKPEDILIGLKYAAFN